MLSASQMTGARQMPVQVLFIFRNKIYCPMPAITSVFSVSSQSYWTGSGVSLKKLVSGMTVILHIVSCAASPLAWTRATASLTRLYL